MLGSLKLNSITKSNVASLDIISITQTSSLLEVYVSKMILTKWKRSCVRLLASSSYSLGKQLGKPYITCEPIWTSYTYKNGGLSIQQMLWNRCYSLHHYTKTLQNAKNQEPRILRIQSVSNLVLKLLFSDCFSMTLGS